MTDTKTNHAVFIPKVKYDEMIGKDSSNPPPPLD